MTTTLTNRLARICFYGPVVAAMYFFVFAISNGRGLMGFFLVCGSLGAALMIFMQIIEIERRELKKQRKVLASYKMSEIDVDNLPTIISSDALTRVVVDEKKGRLYVWLAIDDTGTPLKKARQDMHYRFFNYAFKDLQAVAVVIDGSVYLSREYRLNAVLSNFIDEDTGSVNSAITNAIPNDKVRKMTLLIQTNHEQYPIYPIRLYSDPYAYVEKESADYVKTLESVQLWFDRLDSVISETENKRAVAAVQKPTEREVAKPVQQPAVLGKLAQPRELVAEQEVVENRDVQPAEPAMNLVEKKGSSVPEYSYTLEETEGHDIYEEPYREEEEIGESKELSYFEQLLEKNRKQMNNPPSERK